MMSGSGGGGGGGSFQSEEIACDRLQFETTISSPNPVVIALLQVGSVLDVTVQGGATNTIVLVFQGTAAGGIVSPKALRVRECIAAGTIYKANVIGMRGPVVTVRIVPVP